MNNVPAGPRAHDRAPTRRCRALLLLCLAARSLQTVAGGEQRRDGTTIDGAAAPGLIEAHRGYAASPANRSAWQAGGNAARPHRSTRTLTSSPENANQGQCPLGQWQIPSRGRERTNWACCSDCAGGTEYCYGDCACMCVQADSCGDITRAMKHACGAELGCTWDNVAETCSTRPSTGGTSSANSPGVLCGEGKYLASPSATSCTNCPGGKYSRGVLSFSPQSVREREREIVCVREI